MSQADIYDFLKRNSPNRFSAKEIILNTGVVEDRCFKNLKRLVKYKDIEKEDHKYWVS